MAAPVGDNGGEIAGSPDRGGDPPRSAWRARTVLSLKLLGAAAVLAGVAYRFSGLDFAAVWERISGSGWAPALILLPALCALASDTAGLAACVRAQFTGRLILRVLPARFGCDSLSNALPGGVAIAEPIRSVLLSRALEMSLSEGVATMLTAKVNMAAAQALFLAWVGLAFVLGGGPGGLAQQTPLIEQAVIPAAVLLGALCILVLLFYTGWHPSLPKSLRPHRFRVPAFLARIAAAAGEVSTHVRDFSRGNLRKLAGSLALFLAGWVFAGLESYVILTVLGADVSVTDGLLLEGTASLLRIAFFFLPSALGAAEVGYAALISAFGIGDPLTVSAAYIALKRTREILWIAAGLLVLLSVRWKHSAPPQP